MELSETYSKQCTEAIKAIKAAILQSRYTAARLVNREMLALYYDVGEYVSQHSRIDTWGTGALEVISKQLQQELPGLRGFSVTSLKRMRAFYENWEMIFSNHQSPIGKLENIQTTENNKDINRPMALDDFARPVKSAITINRPLLSDDLSPEDIEAFSQLSFNHHYELILRTQTLEERLFYIRRCATEFWSLVKLKYYLNEKLYSKQPANNNFSTTIANADYRKRALQSFKDEYLLDFINIEDPDDTDERVIESQIVQNIKKFIMALGSDFSFIGNQYRLIVDEKEYFIDLLFFNRRLQSLIAIELKRGEFKPEYAGKLNFYLSAR